MRVQALAPLATRSTEIVQVFVALGKLALFAVHTEDVNPPQITLFPLGQVTSCVLVAVVALAPVV